MTVDAVSDLDLSYTPPLGSPWDAVQIAAQAWTRSHHPTGDLRPALIAAAGPAPDIPCPGPPSPLDPPRQFSQD